MEGGPLLRAGKSSNEREEWQNLSVSSKDPLRRQGRGLQGRGREKRGIKTRINLTGQKRIPVERLAYQRGRKVNCLAVKLVVSPQTKKKKGKGRAGLHGRSVETGATYKSGRKNPSAATSDWQWKGPDWRCDRSKRNDKKRVTALKEGLDRHQINHNKEDLKGSSEGIQGEVRKLCGTRCAVRTEQKS